MASKKTCKLIKEAIADEKKGVYSYVKLGRKLVEDGNVSVAKVVGRIASDEAGHELKLMKLKKTVCK